MEAQPPIDPHDFALWLFSHLEELAAVNNGILWEGRLPEAFDFELIASRLENDAISLSGTCRADTRIIEFYPSHVGVYENLDQLLSHASSRVKIPDRFTLRESNFHYPPLGDCTTLPPRVAHYLDAVRLFCILRDLADVRNGEILFVQSHEAQLAIVPDYSFDDLRELPSFATFAAEFSASNSHIEQKRAIIRAVLIEQFRPSRSVRLAKVLEEFEEIATNARHSLCMYMAEFSVAKVKSEVERQNLDDTLNTNKVISDIQNQLLALPAAVLLAGATIKVGEPVRNYSVLAGVWVFTVFVLILASNQLHSIESIKNQVNRRKQKVKGMPSDSSRSILPLFITIERRLCQQRGTISFIQLTIVFVAFLTTVSVLAINHPNLRSLLLSWWDQVRDFL